MSPSPNKEVVHNYTFKWDEGKVTVKCRCGGVSPAFDEKAEWDHMIEWCNQHHQSVKEIIATVRQVR